MASATLNPAVTETTVVEVSPATVTVTLSLDEAEQLETLLGRGSGMNSLSDLYTDLYNARNGVENPSGWYTTTTDYKVVDLDGENLPVYKVVKR
jgi:hypothetical protein